VRDLNELQRLAEQGHDESQFLLGHSYSKGQHKDIGKAKVWLERAAMANNPRAQYYLGELCAELGRGDPRAAYSHMAYWWNKSSNHPYWETMEGMDGRAVSKRRLVWLHMHSDYENANPEEALALLGELANKYSSPRSAIELGIVYAAGSFMPLSQRLGNAPIQKDAENGFRLIERGLKIIENGSNDIDYALYSTIGDMYLNRDAGGPRAEENLQQGIHYKTKALERAAGVNEGAAINIKNELASLENELRQMPASHQALPHHHEPARTLPPARTSEMVQKFERFHAYFDTLTLEGKRDFIANLTQKLQANPNPDYQGFLQECIEKYRIAHSEAQGNIQYHPHATDDMANTDQMSAIGGESFQDRQAYDATRAEFFQAPGAFGQGYDDNADYQSSAFADPTGNATQPMETYSPSEYDHGSYAQTLTEENYDYNGYQQPKVETYDSASYTDRIHDYGKSGLFMMGAVLYTIGGLIIPITLWLMTQHASVADASRRILGYGMMAVLTLLPILPIVSLWMIYMASKKPRPPEKSLTALSLFRVTFFLHLGVIMAGAALMALQFGADGEAFFGFSIFNNPLDMVIVLVGLAIIVLYVTFFYGSLFSIIKGIRDGIYSNMFDSLTGVGPFSVISYLAGILVILGAVGVILIGVAPVESMPFEASILDTVSLYAGRWFGESYGMALAAMAFGVILSRVGSLLCTNVVNQFNSGLGEVE